MKNRTNSCKKWLAVLLSVSMLPTAILQNGSMAYAEEKKQEEAVTAEEALELRHAGITKPVLILGLVFEEYYEELAAKPISS